MSFIDEQMQDYFDTLGMFDDDGRNMEYDDRFILERRQRPSSLGGVDWRYEKGGVFCDD